MSCPPINFFGTRMQTSEISPSRKWIRANGQLKPSGPPPALHLFGIGPGLPYSFDGCVKDACKNEVPLPASQCPQVSCRRAFLGRPSLVLHSLFDPIHTAEISAFQSIRKPIRHEVGLSWGPHNKRKLKYDKEQCLLVEPSAKPRNEEAKPPPQSNGLPARVFP
jgi:hypothetical protein